MHNRITIHPKICHGKPRVKGTRIMVSQILDLLAAGVSQNDIISDDYFPDLTLKDVQACVAFANHLVKNEDIHIYTSEEIAR